MGSLFVGVGVLIAANVTAASMIWDLKADWSNTSNPNGSWSYNEGANPLPFTSSWSLGPGQDGWGESSPPLPFWFRANSAPPSQDYLVGDIMVHTTDGQNGAGNGPANVTWTSPITGMIDISGSAWMDDNEPTRGNQWSIYLNNDLLAQGFLSGSDPYTRASPFDFSTGSLSTPNALDDIPVTMGDVVKLEYVRTSPDGYFVGTELTITGTIPEPGSIALLALAGLALLVRQRCRRA